MVWSKCRHDYDLIIAHACFIGGLFSGKFRPTSANPYRTEIVPPKMSKEQRKESLDTGVKCLGIALAGLYNRRLKKKKPPETFD